MTEYYKGYANRREGRDRDFGNGMVELIRLLQNDPEIHEMSLGQSMDWLLIALPDYGNQSIHIMKQFAPETYEIFLTPDTNEEPDATVIHLNEAVDAVKEHLGYLRENKAKQE